MHSNKYVIEKNACEKQTRRGEAETGHHSSYTNGYKYTQKTENNDTAVASS